MIIFFFFKQKTAYEMRISDWSSDVCSSDLIEAPYRPAMLDEGSDGMPTRLGGPSCLAGAVTGDYRLPGGARIGPRFAFLDQAHYSIVKTTSELGRASCRERVCQSV